MSIKGRNLIKKYYTFTTSNFERKFYINISIKNIKNMYKKIFYVFGIVMLISNYIYAQNATLKGTVTDEQGKPVAYATVKLMQEGTLLLGAVTGDDGSYTIKPIPTGKFDLEVTYVGCTETKISGIDFRGSQVKFQDVNINCGSQDLEGVVIIAKPPIIELDQTRSEEVMDGESLSQLPGKSISNAISMMSGVVGSGSDISVRGNRPGETVFYQDGVRMSGSGGIPAAAVASVSLIAGGIPARYGNATSVIEIETKGPAREYHGSIDATGAIDGYNNGSMQVVISGPLQVKRKASDAEPAKKKKERGRVGFMIAGLGSYSPGSIIRGGTYRAPQSLIDKIVENPLRPAMAGNSSAAMNPEIAYITKDQLDISKRVQNGESYGGTLTGKLDIRTPANIDLIMSGRFSYSKGRSWSLGNSIFNSANNPETESLGGLGMIRFTQRFTSDTGSIFQNAYYRIQVDYQLSTTSTYNKFHRDNIFDYGYIGKFVHSEKKNYTIGSDTINGHFFEDVYVLTNYYYPVDTFIASDKNPAMARYTELAYQQLRKDGYRDIYDEMIQQYNGLLNGENPTSAYSMFAAPGVGYDKYSKSKGQQLGLNAYLSFDLKDHAVELGYQFEQSISQSFVLSATPLWTLMRQKANSHIEELDETTAKGVYIDGIFVDTINYNKLINYESQSTFDKSLRTKLGAADDEWIDIDSYDPETFSLDMFSAEELLNEGNNYVAYSGYNYLGTKTTNKPLTMEDMKKWFNGDSSQILPSIGASKPIYMAFYMQDRFSIKTLLFNIGLRLDVFDANTPVIKDMYLFREAYTVKEVKQRNDVFVEGYTVPGSIGDDYVMYVIDPTADELQVTAYRNGNTWYDASGNIVTDPNDIAQSVGETALTPYLKDMPGPSNKTKVNWRAFQDYTPTFDNGGITLSPRLSFSFAVSDQSVFYAHYNVTTQRQYQMASPISYFFLQEGNTISNTSLKPSQSIDYEIGFRQAIGKDMALTLAAYYSEKRDNVQAYRYAQAYPFTYYSYTNIDFGTTQGFNIRLEMRRIKFVQFQTNYTLQFAKGTGSSAASNIAIIASGQPNLRTLNNLSYDRRHAINANLNFGFGHGEGPKSTRENKKTGKAKEIRWLENTSLNLSAQALSGLPYTRSSTVQSVTGQGTTTVLGSINGSRLPWSFSCDAKIQRVFVLASKNKEKTRKMPSTLSVYLDIYNIFNFKNITSVYPYTGNPLDDGYLTDADFQNFINSQLSAQSFIDYYTIVMETGRIGYPRRFVLGITYQF